MIAKTPDIRITRGEVVDPTAMQRTVTLLRAQGNALVDIPILGGNLITEVPINEGDVTLVRHNLGRKPAGWFRTRTRLRGAESFFSAPQTITSSGLVTLTHGLGGVPTEVELYLRCVTAEDGFLPGDELLIRTQHNTAERGATVYSTATQTKIAYAASISVFETQPAAGGIAVAIVNANFRAVVRATRYRTLIDQQTSEPETTQFLRLRGSGFLPGENVDLWVF